MIAHLFVDYDNFDWSKIHFRSIIEEIEKSLSKKNQSLTAINARLYGGWHAENNVTTKRINAILTVSEWPSIIKTGGRIVRAKYHFADTIFDAENEEVYQVKETVKQRSNKQKGSTIKTKNCTSKNCKLTAINKWLKNNKACSEEKCSTLFSDVFFRQEQKQVDTHLTTDVLIYSIKTKNDQNSKAYIISSDSDIIPCLQGIINLALSEKVAVIKSKGEWHNEEELKSSGIEIENL